MAFVMREDELVSDRIAGGGAVRAVSSLAMTNCTFSNNSARRKISRLIGVVGGAVYVQPTVGFCTIDGCKFRGNRGFSTNISHFV